LTKLNFLVFFSVLSVSRIHREREGPFSGQRRPVRVPAVRPEDPEQPPDHVPVQPGIRPRRGPDGGHLHRRILEPPAASQVPPFVPC
jgi:hypothetical protein